MLDYTTLRLIWWFLLGFLLIGYAVMDGFDLGAVAISPWVAKTDMEKRIIMNALGPIWEGNQVWIILGGGAIFAAWPYLYAASFSGFYLAMMVVLAAFILRPVSFKYRSKMQNTTWRSTWDILLMLSGFIPALLFGVAIGNVLQGVPFHFDNMLRFYYTGSFFGLLNPFALFCGVVSLLMLCMHGAVYLSNKTVGELQQRTRHVAMLLASIVIVLFAVGGIWGNIFVAGYHLVGGLATNGPSNPLHKEMVITAHQWLQNYQQYPYFMIMPILGFAGALLTILCCLVRFFKLAMITSAACVAGIVGTVGVSLFPILLPSSSNPSQSLLIWDASSSQLTLWLMLIVGIIFFPIIIAYTTWIFHVMRGPVDEKEIEADAGSY